MQVLCGQVLGFGLSVGRPVWVLLAALGALGGAVVTGVVSSPRSVILRSLLPLFLGCAAAAPLALCQETALQRLLVLARNLPAEETRFRALITGPLIHRERRCHFRAAPEFLSAGDLDCSFRATDCPDLAQGDVVLLLGTLKPFPRALNPGELDRRQVLARRGLVGQARLSYPPLLLRPGVVPPSPLDRARQTIYRGRPAGLVSSETHALGVSMVLGDRSLLDPEVVTWFRLSGATHLLAISGMNLAITWVFVLYLLRLLLLPFSSLGRFPGLGALPWLGACLTVLFQTLLAGCQPSCLRACTMLLYLGVARILGREARPMEALALAALCNMALDPQSLADPGFQLSMAATAGIMLAVSHHRPRGLAGLLFGTLQVSLVASAVTAPISAWHFHQLPPLAFLLTLPLLLVFSPVLVVVQVQLLVQSLFGTSPWPLAALADFLAQGFLAGLEATWDLGPLLFVTRPRLPGLSLLCAAVLLPLVLPRPLPRALPRQLSRLACLGLLLWALGASGAPVHAHVHVFHCGQGNAALLELPGAGRLLLDAGPPGCGRRVLLPFLAREGISHLDAFVLSHGHDDHFGGLAELGLVLLPDKVFSPDTAAARRAVRTAIPNLPPESLVVLAAGSFQMPLPRGPLRLLSPGPPAKASSENDASLTLFLTWPNAKVVFPGDLGWNGWRRVADRIPHDPVHFLQVPHHGSPSPVLSPLFRKLTPYYYYVFADEAPKKGGFLTSPDARNDPQRSTLVSGQVGYCRLDLDRPLGNSSGGPGDWASVQPKCFQPGPWNDRGVGNLDPF